MPFRRIHAMLFLLPLVASLTMVLGYGRSMQAERIIGYADRLSVQPGQTIRFMVSSELPQYRADIVRLIHGDPNPKGPGFKEELAETPINSVYPGRKQELNIGSYAVVPDSPPLRQQGSLSLQAWIYPTTPQKGVQGILTKWSARDHTGYGLFVGKDGSLALSIGDRNGRVAKVRSSKPLHRSSWYFVAATFDARSGRAVLYQEPVVTWPIGDTGVMVEQSTQMRSIGNNDVSFLMGAYWESTEPGEKMAGGHFNGKIDSPRLFSRALNEDEIEGLKQGASPRGLGKALIAAWDFAADISSSKVTDTSPNKLHGKTVNMPMRASTGHNWTQNEMNFNEARHEYGAIYFHDDDLEDAGWEVDFEFRLPDQMKSGIYAARLRAGNAENYIPFFVRPKKGTAAARIAYLIPTFNYLAYANHESKVPGLLDVYDEHSDGSGVCYSSRLRPIPDMRPKSGVTLATTGRVYLRHFSADLYLADWMEAKGYQYDVITDEDVHHEGEELLAPYRVVVTGSHPEYWSRPMLDGLKRYLEKGGRLMYLGGNGFYWVTSMDPEHPHVIEVRRWGGTQAWEAAPGEYYHSTTGELGGLWRFRGRAPQLLVGVGFTADGWTGRNGVGRNAPYRRQPGSFDPRASFIFEGVGPDELIGDFESLGLEYGAAGDEIDRFDHALGTPAHALLLATASDFSDDYQHAVEEVRSMNARQGGTVNPLVRSDIVYFEYPNGGAVFSVGSITWFGSLSFNGYDNNVSRITENVMKRFASDEPLPEE